jgi:hypothetical protein
MICSCQLVYDIRLVCRSSAHDNVESILLLYCLFAVCMASLAVFVGAIGQSECSMGCMHLQATVTPSVDCQKAWNQGAYSCTHALMLAHELCESHTVLVIHCYTLCCGSVTSLSYHNVRYSFWSWSSVIGTIFLVEPIP